MSHYPQTGYILNIPQVFLSVSIPTAMTLVPGAIIS